MTSTATTATIDSNGGTITVTSGPLTGASIIVPAGAVATATLFSIDAGTLISLAGFTTAGPPIELGPTGVSFAVPVTVSVPFDPALIPAGRTTADLVVLRRDASSSVTVLPQSSIQGNLITTSTLGFSTFMAAAPTPASSLVFKTVPSSASVDEAFSTTVEVDELDASGQIASVASDSITLAIGSNPGNASLLGTVSAVASGGVALFPGLGITRAGNGYTLVAGALGLTGATSSPINVALAHLSLVSGDGQTGRVTTSAPNPLVVSVTGSGGAPLAGVAVSFAVSSGAGTLTPTTSVTNAQGLAQTTLTFTSVAGAVTVQATATGVAGPPANFHASALAGAATGLTFVKQPHTTYAGIPLIPAPVVAALDQYGNVVSDGSVTITIAIANNPGGATLVGTTSQAAFGLVSFGSLTIDPAASGYTLLASAPQMVGATSAPFDVLPAAPYRLAFATQPPNGAPGQALAPAVRVSILDHSDNVVTSSTAPVTLALRGNGTLGGTTTVSAVNGVATFSNLTIDQVGVGDRMTATSPALASIDSNPFTISGGPSAKLAFVVQPAHAAPHSTMARIDVGIYDASGALVATSNAPVTMALANNPGGSTLAGTTTVNAVNGIARFTDLWLDQLGNGYTFQATSTSLTSATSTAFDVRGPGVPARVLFTSQLHATPAGTIPTFTVGIYDSNNQPIPSSSASITIGIASGPNGATVQGTTTRAAVSGAATFDDLVLPVAGDTWLLASSPGLTSSSSGIPVSAAAPDHLAFVTPPSDVAPGASFSPPIQVALYDRFGNLYVQPNFSVRLGANPGGGSLLGQTDVPPTFSTGITTFTGLAIDKPGIATTLVFSPDGYPGITLTSSPFNVGGPGTPAQLVFRAVPGSVAAGSAISPDIQVEVRDEFGVVVTSATTAVVLRLGANTGGGSLSGTLIANAAGGVADFGNVVIDKAGSYTLVAEASAVSSGTSAPFTVTASGVARLAFRQQPTNVAPSAPITPAVTVALLDGSGNVVPSSANVTIAIGANPGGATLGGTTTVSAVNGIATFTDLSLSATGNGFTLVASAPGVSGTSATFNVSGSGVAAKLAFTVPPVTTVARTAIPSIQVTVEDTLGNPVASTATVALISTNAALRAGVYGTLAQPATGGVATFTGVTATRIATGYALVATSPGLTPAVSPLFDITAGPPTFDLSLPKLAAPRKYITPTALENVVVADIDGDGFPDVVATGHQADMAYVWRGIGNGSLGPRQEFPDGEKPIPIPFPNWDPSRLVAVGDLNGDGHPDLAIGPITSGNWNTGDPPTSFAILFQDPATPGSFLPPKLIDVGSMFSGLAIGDVDGDGLADIVVASSYPFTGTVLVIRQDPNAPGNFLTPVPYTTLVGADLGVTIVDLDGDGYADLVVTGVNRVGWLRQDPAHPGTFLAAVDLLHASSAIVRDVNGDGAPDLIGITGFMNGPQQVVVSLQDASNRGRFLPPMAFGMGSYIGMVATADWDHDGKLDLLATNTNSILRLAVALQDPIAPSFEPPQFSYKLGLGGFVVADLEQNGGNDLVGLASDSVVIVSEDRAHPGAHFFGEVLQTNSFNQVVCADMNGDGKPDIVAATSGRIEALFQDASTPFSFGPETTLATTNGLAGGFALADMNGDGLNDLVFTDPTAGTVKVQLQDASLPGTFLAAVSYPAGGASPGSLAIADIDGDGIPDVLVTLPAGPSLALLRGSAAQRGTLLAATVASNVGGGGPAVGDFDGDGVPDVALLSNGFLWILLQNASARGTFKPAVSYPTVTYPQCSPVVADLDGDGKADVVVAGWSGSVGGPVGVHLGAGNGTMKPVTFYSAPLNGPKGLTVADVNGDGRPDLLLADEPSNLIILVQDPNAPGSFVEGPSYKCSLSSVGVAVADFDGDGHLDVVVGNENGPFNDVLRNLGLSAAPAPLPSPPPPPSPSPPPSPPPPSPGIALSFTVQPSTITAGQVEPAIRVAFQDLQGNTIASITSSVTIAIGVNSGARLSGTTTVQAVNGVASFTDLSISTSNTSYTLLASATGIPSAQSSPFDVNPGPPDHLAWNVGPRNATAGVALSPALAVSILDSFGNVVPSPALSVSLSIGANPGGSTLAGTLSRPATTGTASFNDISLNRSGIGYTVVAAVSSNPSIQTATSGSFDITHGPLASLTVTVQPTTVASQAPITPAAQVELFDALGNVVINQPLMLNVALASNPGSSVLGGSTSVSPANGFATFPGLTLDKAGTGYTLRFFVGNVSVTSAPFDVVPGPVRSMSIDVQPSNTYAATPISPALKLTLRDAKSNIATNATGAVTVALATNPSGATLSGTTSVTPSNGVVTFSGLTLDKVGSGYSFFFSTSGAPTVQSAGFDVQVGAPPVALAIGVQPHDIAATDSFIVTVRVVDAGGNIVPTSSAPITLALAANPAGATLNGTLTRNAVNGVARFLALSVDRAGGPCTINATATSLTGTTSKPFQVFAAPDVVSLSVPAGTLGGKIPVTYSVAQSASQRVDVLVEVDPTGTGAFRRATQAASDPGSGNDGVVAVTTSPTGVSHVFLWNSTADLPSTTTSTAIVRVTARLGPLAGAARTVANLSITNGPWTQGLAAPISVGISGSSFYGQQLVVGDFNGDGKPDLACSNSRVNTVGILLGRGDGTYAPATTYATGAFPFWVATADLNNDGFLDLVTINRNTNDMSVLLGKGDGTFLPETRYAVPGTLIGAAIGDMNEDGVPDIVVLANSTIVSVLQGKGDGTFLAPAATSVWSGQQARWIVLADMNGDGHLDVLDIGSYTVLLGDGTGALRSINQLPSPQPIFPMAIAVGDLNGDGIPDLAIADQYNQGGVPSNVWVYLGTGDGTLRPGTAYPIGFSGSDVRMADLNGDGKLDIVVTSASTWETNNVTVLTGDGNGGFSAKYFTCGNAQSALQLADVNSDGKLDLVSISLNGTTSGSEVFVCFGEGAGNFVANPKEYALPTNSNPAGIASGDLNGDGTPDVIVACQATNQMSVLLGASSGAFGSAASFNVGTTPCAVALADLNGDGKLDAVVANSGSNDVSVLLGTGTGSFGIATSFAAGAGPKAVAIGDVDGDGKLDIVVANTSANTVSILLGNGDGTFRAPTSLATGGTSPIAVALVDLDADGKLDIVAAEQGGDIAILMGTGGGGFGAPSNTALGGAPLGLAIADLDADGKPDVVVTIPASNTVAVLYGTGTGGLTAPTTWTVGRNPLAVAVGDMDGDGRLDIVTSNADSWDVSIVSGAGSRTFAAERRFAVGFRFGCVAVALADLNADGRLDVLVTEPMPPSTWGTGSYLQTDGVAVLLGR